VWRAGATSLAQALWAIRVMRSGVEWCYYGRLCVADLLDGHPGVGDAEGEVAAVSFVVVEVDATAELAGGGLEFPVFRRKGAVEVGSGVVDTDHGAVVVHQCLDLDHGILVFVVNGVQEVPEDISEEILFGNKTKALGYAIKNDVVILFGEGSEAGQQVLGKLMQRNFDPFRSKAFHKLAFKGVAFNELLLTTHK
jgi:hypothetical protein